jgi:truncated hemoglobin YjbI
MTQHLVHNGKLNTKDAKFKDDLVDKICESEFDFLLISFCERIQNDARLQRFYGSYALKSLMTLQKELLLVAFWDVPKEDTEVLKGRLVLRHHRLWQLGFNERHFDILRQHFVDAMRDCWIDNCLLELCKISFDELRPMFKEHGTTFRMADRLEDIKMDMLSLALRDQKER